MAYSKARRLADLIRSDGTIDTTKILDATIAAADIANDAITANKIVDNIALPGNITTSGTLAPVGVLTANAGIVVDNITIDGTQINLSSGNLTLDVAGNIILDADGGSIELKDGGTGFGSLFKSSSNMIMYSSINNGDIKFQGVDGGSNITALTLDMSDAGTASFNHDVNVAGDLAVTGAVAITGGISGNPTTTTQSASDNTTKIATTAYVTTALANLSDSAPSTLNTLNELAAALGDDANYATTTTAAIAAKAPLASPAFTGTPVIGTSTAGALEVGSANSFQIQKSGVNAYINQSDSGPIIFRMGSGFTERMRIDSSGKVRIGATLGLNHLLNIQTASTSGLAQMEFRNTMAGTQIGMPANTNALSFFVGDNERMRITGPAAAEDRVGIGGDPTSRLHLIGNSDVSDQDVMLKIQDNDTSAGSKIPAIGFYGGTTLQGRIRGSDSGMFFSASANNNDDLTILSTGKVLAGTTSNNYNRGKFTVFGTPGNPATTGTNADNVAIRVATDTGNSQSFDIGMYNSGDYGAWLQASNSGSLQSHSPIVLNPNGGKVGIGTASPAALLHINGSGDAVRVTSTNTGSGGAQVDLLQYTTSPADNDIHGMINFGGYTSGTSSAYGSSIRSVWSDVSAKEGQLQFFTRDDSDFAARMIIDKDGNVGIGTDSPDHPLEVVGAISSADTGLQKATFANVGNDLVMTANAGATNVSSNIIFKSSQSGGSAAERMRISSVGNVHLNTGVDARVQLGTSGTGATSVSDNSVYIRGNDDDLILGAAGNGNISFKENADTRMFIKTGGNVGINVPNPTHKLQVLSTDNKGFYLERNTGNEPANINEFSSFYSLSIKNRAGGSFLNFGGNSALSSMQATDGAGSATAKEYSFKSLWWPCWYRNNSYCLVIRL